MTNYEFYKGDADALREAFGEFCAKQEWCGNSRGEYCRLNTDNLTGGIDNLDCFARFICAEHEESPKPKKRRPYTFEEAKGLLGKRLEYYDDCGCWCARIIEIVTYDGKEVLIACEEQAKLMEWGATIDGEPFGVEVAE